MQKKPKLLYTLSLLVISPLSASVHAALTSNPDYHISGSGEQTQTYTGLNIHDDYYYLISTDANASLTINDSIINTGTSTNPYAIDVDSKETTQFNADALTTAGQGEVSLGGQDVEALIMNSNISNQDKDAVQVSSKGYVDMVIQDSSLEGRLYISSKNDTTVNVTNSTIDGGAFGGVYLSNSGTGVTNVYITDSTIQATKKTSTDSSIPVNVQGHGDKIVVINNSDISMTDGSSPSSSNDITVYATNGGSGSAVIENGSTVQRGISVYADAGSNATVSISDSQIGTPETADDVSYMAVAQVGPGGDNSSDATLFIDNSTIIGNITAQATNEGSSQVYLSGSSQVNGNVRLVGSDMQLDINDATLNGYVKVSSYDESDISATSTTLNVTNATYRGNVYSNDTTLDDSLTVNLNNGAVIGGETQDTAQQIIGFNNVNINVNYLDPSLINTGKHSWFTLSGEEVVSVNSSITDGSGILTPVRSGSYIYNDIIYQATEEATDAEGNKTYDVIFYTDGKPTPPSGDDTAPDIQASQAGLLASDDMIHRIADGISRELDTRYADNQNHHLWIQGIHASGDRNAGDTRYNNNIGGFQLGGDVNLNASGKDVILLGGTIGYLHNSLDLRDKDGSNDIEGLYSSVYGRWQQYIEPDSNWGLFADLDFTCGDMSYSAQGDSGTTSAGGDYDGRAYLIQSRLGARGHLPNNFWLQPYATLGYVNIHTDGYFDGYSNISSGKQDGGFTGAGMKMGTTFAIGSNTVTEIIPYVDLSYLTQFDTQTTFETEDYQFKGQNLDGGNAGIGMQAKLSGNWSVNASVNTMFGQDVDKEVNANLGASLRF